MSALNLPLAHVAHELSAVVLPAVKPSVATQSESVNARHAPVLCPALNVLPDSQFVHVESAEALPTPYPLPATHFVKVHGVHAPSLSHDPVAHAPAQAASLLAVPAVSGAPAGHVGVECVWHAVWSLVAEYVFPTHAVHVASALDEPAA